jgi:hypothetical protein
MPGKKRKESKAELNARLAGARAARRIHNSTVEVSLLISKLKLTCRDHFSKLTLALQSITEQVRQSSIDPFSSSPVNFEDDDDQPLVPRTPVHSSTMRAPLQLDSDSDEDEDDHLSYQTPVRSSRTPGSAPKSAASEKPRGRSFKSTPSKSPRKASRARTTSKARSTSTPGRSRTPARELGPLRDTPCLGCVRSALAGRSNGACYDNKAGGRRCYRCSSGHNCRPVPPAAAPVCSKFIDELQSGTSSASVSLVF